MSCNKLYLCLCLFISISTPLLAQSFLEGQVFDENKQALFAANVYFKQQPQNGAFTDFEGKFKIALSGIQLPDTLTISYIGYQDTETIVLDKDSFPSHFHMETSTNLLTTIQVNAKRPVASEFSIRELDKFDIYSIPFSFADPLKAISILPSSTNTSETADVVLRGSHASQSLITLNGVPIFNPVRSTSLTGNGFFSIFNPELLNNQTVYAGNPPLSYGNTTAGLVEMEMVDQLDANFTQLTMGLANLGFMHGRQLGKKVSTHIYSNFQSSPLFKSVNAASFEFLDRFRVNDVGALLNIQFNNDLSLDWFSYGLDEASIVNTQLYTFNNQSESRSRRFFHVARLTKILGEWVFSANLGSDYNHTKFNFGAIKNDNQSRRYYAAINAKYNLVKNWTLQGGITTDYSQTRFNNQSPTYFYALDPSSPVELEEGLNRNTNQEFYLLSKSKFFDDKLSFISAIRKNIPTSNKQNSYWSQQFILKYTFNKHHAISANTGLYNGYDLPTVFNNNYRFTKATQRSIEYEYNSKNLKINASIFSKNESGDTFITPEEIYDTRQIEGLEMGLSWQITKHLQISGSYNFLDVENKIDDGEGYPGLNDLDYFGRLFLNYNNPKTGNLSIAYISRQGLWYSPVIGANFDENLAVFEPAFENQFNTQRFDNYQNISLNYSKEIPLKNKFLLFFATINNLLNIKNQRNPIYSFDYSVNEFEYYQLRSLYFGWVLKW